MRIGNDVFEVTRFMFLSPFLESGVEEWAFGIVRETLKQHLGNKESLPNELCRVTNDTNARR